MDCDEFLEGYSDYLDGQFEERPFAAYWDHLGECSGCAGYDRVMRRGLRLVRALDPPDPTPEFRTRLETGFLDRRRRLGTRADYPFAAGFAAAVVVLVASLAVLRSQAGTVQLPPVVVDGSARGEGSPALWGPPPTFTWTASFLQAPVLDSDSLLLPGAEGFSLFRVPRRPGDPPARPEETAPE